MNEKRVQDLMSRDVVTVSPEMPISEAAARLTRSRISAVPVIEAGAVVGIISESDIVTALAPPPATGRKFSVLDYLLATRGRRPLQRRRVAYLVRQAMTDVVFMIAPDATISEAAALMERHRVGRLPVTTEQGRLVGIISKADLVRSMARDDESMKADVVRALALLGDAASGVHVDVTHFEVVLSGVAGDSQTIRGANDLAVQVPGVVGVRNLIDLQRETVELDLIEKELDGLDRWAQGGWASAEGG